MIAVTCTAATAASLAHRFVRSWNMRNIPAAVATWAPEPEFQWLSGPHRLGSRAYARSTVGAYVRSSDERLRIVKMSGRYDPARDIVDFAGKLSVDGATPKDFKGAVTCATPVPLLIVWSM